MQNVLCSTWHWIGLSDGVVEDEWHWVDTSKAVFTQWEVGQPASESGDQDCANINEQRQWLDVGCEYQTKPILCQSKTGKCD